LYTRNAYLGSTFLAENEDEFFAPFTSRGSLVVLWCSGVLEFGVVMVVVCYSGCGSLFVGPTKATSLIGCCTDGFALNHYGVFHGGDTEVVGLLAALGNLGLVAIDVQDTVAVLDPDYELCIRLGHEALDGDIFVGGSSDDILFFVTLGGVMYIFVLVKDALDHVCGRRPGVVEANGYIGRVLADHTDGLVEFDRRGSDRIEEDDIVGTRSGWERRLAGRRSHGASS